MKRYLKSILPNGLTVISHTHPYVNSAVIALWVNVGSSSENPDEEGFSHFIEHMLFKGTDSSSASDIVKKIEKLGGEINAFTTREHTCFLTNVLGRDYKEALQVLLDISFHSTMDKTQFDIEKTVVQNELVSVEDDPEDLITDRLYEKIFSKNTFGHSILGTKKSISSCTKETLFNFYKKHYTPNNIIISCTGNIVHDDICSFLSSFNFSNSEIQKKSEKTIEPTHCFEILKKEYEQIHCVIGFPCVSYSSQDRYKALVLNSILGGGMSSRLFQNVREKFGLIYNIYSDLNLFKYTSLLTVYFAAESEHFSNMLKKVIEEIKILKQNSINNNELAECKNQLIGSSMISMDDLDTEMSVLARSHFYVGRYIPLDEAISHLNKVTSEEMNIFARKTFTDKDFGIIIAGNINSKETKIIEGITNELKN